MKISPTKFSTITILHILAFFMTSTLCRGQEWSRKEIIEIYGASQYMGGVTTHETITGRKGTLKVDSSFTFGVGLGYNINNHLNVNTHILFGTTDIKMTIRGLRPTTDNANLWVWDANLDYNIMKGCFTPVVTGGIGTMSFSGSGFSETDFSYNLGAGVRWDFSDKFFVKVLYKNTWTELEDTDSRVKFDGVSVSAGFKRK